MKGSRARLLRWYEPRRRAYPWRSRPTPYRVLVSEFMLQQTQAPRVVPAFRAFVRRFPSVAALAAAPRRDVVSAWSGLGHNRRAVSLHDAARAIVAEHSGRIPHDVKVLQQLPGVGPYTASAVASVAFGEPVSAVDTNVRRVVSRVRFGADTGDISEHDIDDAARRWLDPSDPAAWNQALMDLGREICRPAPRCDECPLARDCAFSSSGAAVRASVKRRTPKQTAFEGSFRQVRGGVIRELSKSTASGLSLATLASRCGQPMPRVTKAVRALARDGLVAAGPAAFSGSPGGRVRLAC